MRVYVDTSVLAAYYRPKPLSLAAERALRNLSSPMISDLTLVEFASAISRKVREKTLLAKVPQELWLNSRHMSRMGTMRSSP